MRFASFEEKIVEARIHKEARDKAKMESDIKSGKKEFAWKKNTYGKPLTMGNMKNWSNTTKVKRDN